MNLQLIYLFCVPLHPIPKQSMVSKFIRTLLQTQSFYRQIIHRKIRENNIDITIEMLQVFRHLAIVDKINQQVLANLMFKDKSSLSYLIKSMERRGFVLREEDASDKRSKLVSLTDEGKVCYARITAIIDEAYLKMEEKANLEHLQICLDYMQEFLDTTKEK